MERALTEARRAARREEVPIGAVVVMEERCVARAHNLVVTRHDPTAHAEVLALRQAAKAIGNERLGGAVLYTTLEPCAMCVGALMLARVQGVVYAASDPKAGALGSTVNLVDGAYGNHRFAVTADVLANKARDLLRDFFKARRA